MAFAVYLAVLLVAGASVLFGLDLMTAPLPDKAPQVEASASNKLERRQADRAEEAKQAHAADDRALSPVYPTAPDNKDVRMVYPPLNEMQGQPTAQTKTAETTGSGGGGSSAPAERAEIGIAKPSAASTSSTASVQSSEPSAAGSASASIKTAPQDPPATKSASESNEAHVTPVTAKSEEPKTSASTTDAGSCNVSACAAAYRSFRSSDCTYQPFQGPRRVCTSPSSSQSSTASLDSGSDRRQVDRRAGRAGELRAVERRVREMTSGDDAADDYLDEARGRRVIVIERGYFDQIGNSNFR